MPPAHQTSQTAPQKERSHRQRTGSDEDETRLLGGPRKNDPGAVTFARPRGRRETAMVRKAFHGGVQPQNTLSKTRNAPDLRNPLSAKSRSSGPTKPTLQMGYSRGGNVECTPTMDMRDAPNEPRSAKRLKTFHEVGPSTSSSSDPDPLDSFHPDQVIITARADSVSSFKNQGNGLILQTSGPSSGVSEFRKVEKMMESGPSTSKADRRKLKELQTASSSHVSSQSRSPPKGALIDITADDDSQNFNQVMKSKVPKPRWQGTAQSAAQIQADTKSPYFDTPRDRSNNERTVEKSVLTEVRLPRNTQAEGRLNNQFVQQNGKHRGGLHPASSSDELATMSTTVGKAADRLVSLSPEKHAHPESTSQKPISTVKSAVTTNGDMGLEPSNIKSTLFANGVKSDRKHAGTEYLAQETKAAWGIPIVSVDGTAGNDLGLVLDEKTENFTIFRAGSPTPQRIQPNKLWRIQWAKSGGKIRFESSRSQYGEPILDLEVSYEKDATMLVRRLGEVTTFCKVLSQPIETMDRMFQTRLSELKRNPNCTRHNVSEADCQNVPALENIDRRARQPETRNKRTIIGDLLSRGNVANNVHVPRKLSLSENSQSVGSNITSILESLRPEHNNHLTRRSTRNSNSMLQTLDNLQTTVEGLAVPKHDLGPRWKKPLSYPNEHKKKVSVDFDDLSRLEEGEFLNDNLIGFYLRYLEYELERKDPNLAKKTYFFNSYFYGSLTNLQKGQKTINFDKVQSWTRKVDLFSKDFIVVPINEAAHWYLAIVCNLPALDRTPLDAHVVEAGLLGNEGSAVSEDRVADVEEPTERETTESFAEMSLDSGGDQVRTDPNPEPQETEMLFDVVDEPKSVVITEGDSQSLTENQTQKTKLTAASKKAKRRSVAPAVTHIDPSKPAIITFDSLGNPHSNVIKHLKQYLYEEGKAKRGGMELDMGQIKGINAKAIPLQNNFSDCGLYLLGYIQKCLQDGPKEFVSKIIKREYKDDDWSSLVPSQLRKTIRNQIQELYRQQKDEQREKAQNKDKIPVSSPKGDVKKDHEPQKDDYGAQSPAEPPALSRKEALKHALSIDEDPEDSAKPKRHKKDHDREHSPKFQAYNVTKTPPPPFLEEPSLIEIQSHGQSQPAAASSQLPANFPAHPEPQDAMELPSEIEDSQPNDASFEIATDTMPHNKSPPKVASLEATKLDSSSLPNGKEESAQDGMARGKRSNRSGANLQLGQSASEVIDVDV